jgi:hypothetical protein
LFQNVLEINNESISQDSIACNAFKGPLLPIVIENANSRFPKCQFDIMENYKPFITILFVSLIGDKPVYNSLKYFVIRELSKPKR